MGDKVSKNKLYEFPWQQSFIFTWLCVIVIITIVFMPKQNRVQSLSKGAGAERSHGALTQTHFKRRDPLCVTRIKPDMWKILSKGDSAILKWLKCKTLYLFGFYLIFPIPVYGTCHCCCFCCCCCCSSVHCSYFYSLSQLGNSCIWIFHPG